MDGLTLLESSSNKPLQLYQNRSYAGRERTVLFAYVTSLRVEGKQTHILRKTKITDIGTETASYKVLSLGNNVYSMDRKFFLICFPSNPTAFCFWRTCNTRFRSYYYSWFLHEQIIPILTLTYNCHHITQRVGGRKFILKQEVTTLQTPP
jgi:glycopeptide antibiotics resistance protein